MTSPLLAGIQTMQSGAHVGLSARQADLADREQALREEHQSVTDQLAREEFEQQKQHAADALRVQSSLASARLAQAAANAAATAGYRTEGLKLRNAAEALREQHSQKLEDFASRSLALREAEANKKQGFKPGAPIVIRHPETGAAVGLLQQESPQTWRMVKEPPSGDKALTPAQAGTQLYNRAKIIEFQLKNLPANATQEEKDLLNQELGYLKSKLKGTSQQLRKSGATPQRLTWNSDKGDFE